MVNMKIQPQGTPRVTPGQTIVTPGFKSRRHSGSDASYFEIVANFESCPWLAFSYARNQNIGRCDLSTWSQIPMAHCRKQFQVKSLAKH